jgi:hypothetical protein
MRTTMILSCEGVHFSYAASCRGSSLSGQMHVVSTYLLDELTGKAEKPKECRAPRSDSDLPSF